MKLFTPEALTALRKPEEEKYVQKWVVKLNKLIASSWTPGHTVRVKINAEYWRHNAAALKALEDILLESGWTLTMRSAVVHPSNHDTRAMYFFVYSTKDAIS